MQSAAKQAAWLTCCYLLMLPYDAAVSDMVVVCLYVDMLLCEVWALSSPVRAFLVTDIEYCTDSFVGCGVCNDLMRPRLVEASLLSRAEWLHDGAAPGLGDDPDLPALAETVEALLEETC